MKRRVFSSAISAGLFAFLCLGAAQNAFADRPYDFSDITQPLIEWPYQVVSFNVTGAGYGVQHEIRFDISYDKMLKELAKYYKDHTAFGRYYLMSVTEQAQTKSTVCIFASNNEHNYVTIYPDGAGVKVVVDAMPTSYVSGAYAQAVYGFRMPDGGTIPLGRINKDGM